MVDAAQRTTWIVRDGGTHEWAIVVKGSAADHSGIGNPDEEGGIVGSSEWLWLRDEYKLQIVAQYNTLLKAEAVIRAAPCAHGHWDDPHPISIAQFLDCKEADCEQYCPRCAWLRDA